MFFQFSRSSQFISQTDDERGIVVKGLDPVWLPVGTFPWKSPLSVLDSLWMVLVLVAVAVVDIQPGRLIFPYAVPYGGNDHPRL